MNQTHKAGVTHTSTKTTLTCRFSITDGAAGLFCPAALAAQRRLQAARRRTQSARRSTNDSSCRRQMAVAASQLAELSRGSSSSASNMANGSAHWPRGTTSNSSSRGLIVIACECGEVSPHLASGCGKSYRGNATKLHLMMHQSVHQLARTVYVRLKRVSRRGQTQAVRQPTIKFFSKSKKLGVYSVLFCAIKYTSEPELQELDTV